MYNCYCYQCPHLIAYLRQQQKCMTVELLYDRANHASAGEKLLITFKKETGRKPGIYYFQATAGNNKNDWLILLKKDNILHQFFIKELCSIAFL